MLSRMARFVIFVALLVCIIKNVTSSKNQPNIIFILIDDMGWNDIGYHASDQLKTPNLDRLASEGVKLNRYYTQPICTPSRSAIMTGKYPIHTGMQTYVICNGEAWGLGLNETLLPQQLKKQGYSTHAIGKWHLGYHKKEFTPTYRGFDTFYGYYLAESDFFDHTNFYKNVGLDLHENYKDISKPDWSVNGTYNTDLFTQKAQDLINTYKFDAPLFLYLAYQSLHVGWKMFPPLNDGIQVPKEWIEKFKHVPHLGRRKFAAMLGYLDYSIGKLYETLEKRGILDNTIIVVASDNGAEPNGFRGNWGSNYPFRGAKASLFEGGIRVPSFIHSKLLKRKGQPYNKLFHVTDWYPTLLKLAGGRPSKQVDGIDQWNAINNEATSPRREILVNIDSLFKAKALIYDDWKLIKQGKLENNDFDGWCKPPSKASLKPLENEWAPPCFTQNITSAHCVNEYCLFNLRRDPIELHDVSAKYPKIVELMKRRLDKYVKSTIPSRRNAKKDPRADPIYHGNSFEPWLNS